MEAVVAKVKLKSRPEDFQVTELTELTPDGGLFALYRLEKTSIGTLEAVEAIARRWRLPRHRISHGGLKDRHARTSQHLTIERGPQRNLTQTNLKLIYLGQVPEPYTSRHIQGNRFHIVVRGLSAALAEYAQARLKEVQELGVANFFDQQRFGSVGSSGRFIARSWCQGNYEGALWLALAEKTPSDRAREQREKEILRSHWGQWDECSRLLSKSHRRSIATYLRHHPTDFKGAFARLCPELRRLYLAAYQSYLWNELLWMYLHRHLESSQLLETPMRVGRLCFLKGPLHPDQGRALEGSLPLPSARLSWNGEVGQLLEQVLNEEGLPLQQLKVRYPRDAFFSKGERSIRFFPTDLQWDLEADELYPGCKKLSLAFVLGRGCYATLLVKALTVVPKPLAHQLDLESYSMGEEDFAASEDDA